MTRCLTLAVLALTVTAAQAGEGAPRALSTRSFTNTALGSDPHTLTITANAITVDLSAVQGATVYRATLDPYRRPEFYYDRQPDYSITEASRANYDVHPPGGEPLQLRPPRYLTLDATSAVADAIASGSLTLTIDDPGPGFGETVSLDVLCDAPAPAPVPQVSGATARHQDGDTMITFAEIDPPHTETTWTVAGYTNAYLYDYAPDLAPKVRYRIYRSATPFTGPEAVVNAELIDEIPPMTGWNHGLHAISDMQFSGGYEQYDAEIPTLPVEDLELSPPGTGIYVRAHRTDPSEPAYYLISHTVNGAEDFAMLTEGGNATGLVTESAGPGLVLMWRETIITGGWYWSPDRDPILRDYVRWEAPPWWNVPNRPCNYRLGLPDPEFQVPSPTLTIELHAYFGNMFGWREWQNYEEGSVLFTLNHQRYNSYTAFSECMETLRPWDEGTVQPYFYARALSFIHDFALEAYNLDLERTYLSGGSMGGAGTMMWGLRSGHLFAYLISAVGNSIPAEDITWEYEHWGGYGPLSWQLLYSNEQLTRFGYPLITAVDEYSVWDYFDSEQWLNANPAVDTPYISFSNAPNDGAIGWEQAWKVAQAIHDGGRPHNFSWGQEGHGQPVEKIDLPFALHQSVPAFSNCSLDDDLGASPWECEDEGQRNRYFRWDTETITDIPNEWGLDFWLHASAPEPAATADLTPGKLQHLLHEPGDVFRWRLVEGETELSSGLVAADEHGLITVTGLEAAKIARRVVITREDGVLAIAVTDPPVLLPPGEPVSFVVTIEPGEEQLVPDTALLHYRYSGTEFATAPLAALGGAEYQATLPAALCADTPEFYVSAVGSDSGPHTAPLDAPATVFTASVGEWTSETLLVGDFEAGLPDDWSADGLWHTTSACPVLPPCDGQVWAYYGQDDSCDYDTGAASVGVLTTPPIDLTGVPTGGEVTLTYCSTLEKEEDLSYDRTLLLVNGSMVEDVPPSADWELRTVDLSPYAGQTVEVAWFFDTVDELFNEYRGWQVDAVKVEGVQLTCQDPFVPGDLDGDGDVDLDDYATLAGCLLGPGGGLGTDCDSADLDGDGDVTLLDYARFQSYFTGS